MDKISLNIQSNKIEILLMVLAIVFLQGCTSDYIKNLGGGYFYRDEGDIIKDILSKNPNGGEIPATVLSYAYDRKFIIAKQRPKLPQDILYEKEYDYKLGGDTIYFWLIIKREELVLGPLSEEELKEARIEYKVSDKLCLD